MKTPNSFKNEIKYWLKQRTYAYSETELQLINNTIKDTLEDVHNLRLKKHSKEYIKKLQRELNELKQVIEQYNRNNINSDELTKKLYTSQQFKLKQIELKNLEKTN